MADERKRLYCPGCGGSVTSTCHFTYTTWQCWGCGAEIDSRANNLPLRLTKAERDARFPWRGAAGE